MDSHRRRRIITLRQSNPLNPPRSHQNPRDVDEPNVAQTENLVTGDDVSVFPDARHMKLLVEVLGSYESQKRAYTATAVTSLLRNVKRSRLVY